MVSLSHQEQNCEVQCHSFNQHYTEVSSQHDETRKRNRRHPDWRRIKKTIFTGDVFFYKENPKEPTKKLLELIYQVSEVAISNINI